MRVVLGTNVIISAAIDDSSIPAVVVGLWQQQVFELVMSDPLVDEYRRVMNYAHIRRAHSLNETEVNDFTDVFEDADHFVDLDWIVPTVASDPDDDVVVATAVAGSADYIVSGDRHLLELGEHHGIRILRPALILLILQEGPE